MGDFPGSYCWARATKPKTSVRPAVFVSEFGRSDRHSRTSITWPFPGRLRENARSKELGASRQTLSAIVNERSPISPEMAVKIGHYVGNGAEIWARMQMNHDLWHAERRMKNELEKLPRASAG